MVPYCRRPARDLLVFPRQISWFALIIVLIFTILLATLLWQCVASCKPGSWRLGGSGINVNDRFGKWNERITGATAEKASRTQGCV